MLTLLSPAKSLDLTSPLATRKHTQPRLLSQAGELIEVMRDKSVAEVASLMDISEELAAVNVERYRDFSAPFSPDNARPAVLMFDGDVYRGMAAPSFDERDFTEANKSVRILSGLYGVLRPLDLIQPYRLEMGTALRTDRGANLYAWWGTRVTDLLTEDLAESPGADLVVNLASGEYSGVVDFDRLGVPVVSPRFEDQGPKGDWKVISFPAKKARGMMAGWLVRNRARNRRALLGFEEGGYRYQPELSTPDVPVFRRPRQAA